MNVEYVYFILHGIEKLMANQLMLDTQSRRDANLLADDSGASRFMRPPEKTITIEKDNVQTCFTLHDVNFENIDDWDIFR